jgi:DNA-binding CsgD family transcriptional regulator
VTILRAYQSGMPMGAIAKQHDLKRDTVSQLLSRNAVPIRPRPRFGTDALEQATMLYNQGWSLMRISNKLGFNAETIRVHLTQPGVEMRNPWDHP